MKWSRSRKTLNRAGLYWWRPDKHSEAEFIRVFKGNDRQFWVGRYDTWHTSHCPVHSWFNGEWSGPIEEPKPKALTHAPGEAIQTKDALNVYWQRMEAEGCWKGWIYDNRRQP